jgi:membrane protease YdiL (CAAX protease family)
MEETNNTWANILFFLFTYLCVEVVVQGIYIVIADIPLEGDFILSELEFFSIAIISAIASTVVVYLFVKVSDTMPMQHVGLSFRHRTMDFINGALIGGVIMACGFGILSLLGEVSIKQVNVDSNELIFSIVGFLAVAYGEELVFRGYILSKLLTKYSAKYSLVFSSLIFALFHLGNDNLSVMGFIDLVVAGVMLGAFFLYTKNLWMAVGLHFGWNFFQTHLGFNVSGLDSYSMIETTIVESNLLNGGDFGFEGSYLSTMAQVLTLSLLFYSYKKNQRKVSY